MAININAKTTGVGGLETSADNSGNINIQSGGSTVMSVTSSGVAVTGSFSQNGAVYSTQPTFRNLIINGDMRIAQRGTSATGITTTGNGYYTIDRYLFALNSQGTWTNTQSTDVPTGQGFSNSYKLECTTADASPASGDVITLQHRIEAQNCQYLNYGTASAKTTTLSFWIKSNKTGTYNINLRKDDDGRRIVKQYTISAANTWEKKTITIAGDTNGAINNDNGIGLQLNFWLGAGSDFTSGSVPSGWSVASTTDYAPNQVNLADSTSNYINITGVQLEVGSTATEFEHLPVDVELARCERYFEISYNQGTALGTVTQDGAEMWLANRNPGAPHHYLKFRTVKRTIPGVTIYNPSTGATGSFRNLDAGTDPSSVTSRIGHKGTTLYTGTSTGLGQFMQFHYTADAEL